MDQPPPVQPVGAEAGETAALSDMASRVAAPEATSTATAEKVYSLEVGLAWTRGQVERQQSSEAARRVRWLLPPGTPEGAIVGKIKQIASSQRLTYSAIAVYNTSPGPGSSGGVGLIC